MSMVCVSFQHLPAVDRLISFDGHAVIQVFLLSAPVEFYIMVFKIDQKHCNFYGIHTFVCSDCGLYRKVTGEVGEGPNTILFSKLMGGVDNPIRINLSTWKV